MTMPATFALVYGALYLTGCFVLGVLTKTYPICVIAIADAGLAYLCAILQDWPQNRFLAKACMLLSIAVGLGLLVFLIMGGL